jgi:hypothetical protein
MPKIVSFKGYTGRHVAFAIGACHPDRHLLLRSQTSTGQIDIIVQDSNGA